MYLKIKNKKINVIVANNFFQRFIGLMGKKEINNGLLLKKCHSIHTFFMKDQIDVLVLNENNIIVEKYLNVLKNKIIITKQKNTSILELPKNTSKSLKINDQLTFESK